MTRHFLLGMKTKLAIVGCAVLAAAGLAAGGATAWLAANQPPNRPTQPGAALTGRAVTIRGTAMQAGQLAVVSETGVVIEVPAK